MGTWRRRHRARRAGHPHACQCVRRPRRSRRVFLDGERLPAARRCPSLSLPPIGRFTKPLAAKEPPAGRSFHGRHRGLPAATARRRSTLPRNVTKALRAGAGSAGQQAGGNAAKIRSGCDGNPAHQLRPRRGWCEPGFHGRRCWPCAGFRAVGAGPETPAQRALTREYIVFSSTTTASCYTSWRPHYHRGRLDRHRPWAATDRHHGYGRLKRGLRHKVARSGCAVAVTMSRQPERIRDCGRGLARDVAQERRER
jgi:hypothetical protein